jgi:hypothetical protein
MKKPAMQPAQMGDAPSGTNFPEEAGASPAKRGTDMDYISKKGMQKTHPNKPAQPRVMRHLG